MHRIMNPASKILRSAAGYVPFLGGIVDSFCVNFVGDSVACRTPGCTRSSSGHCGSLTAGSLVAASGQNELVRKCHSYCEYLVTEKGPV
jgi:hypothetical protein